MRNKWLLHIFLIPFIFVGCSQESEVKEQLRPVRAMQVEKEPTFGMRTFPGRTRAVGRVSLSFRVEGPLVERPVNVGDQLEAGDLIARIDPVDYEVALQSAEGQLEQSQAKLRFAENDYERVRGIWQKDPGAISKSYLEQKQEEKNRLQGEVKELQAAVDAAKNNYNYTFLRAPFPGTIVATYVNNHEFVAARQPVVRILNNSQIEMVIDVPETLIPYVPLVQTFQVEMDAFPGELFTATVKEIGTEASTTTRTYPVTLLMNQPPKVKILAGMAGSARVKETTVDEEVSLAIIVPPSALFNKGALNDNFVWVVDMAKEVVSKRKVETDGLTNRGVKIASGLKAGEWVVTSGAHSLKEGQRVKLLPVSLNALGEQKEAENLIKTPVKEEKKSSAMMWTL